MTKPRVIKLHELNTLGNNSREILRKIVANSAPELTRVENLARQVLNENYGDTSYHLTVDFATLSVEDGEVIRVSISIPTHNFGMVATYPLTTTIEEIETELRERIGFRLPA